ncbi:MAG: uncharacterized protein A8A55_3652, partial [Amphiamblys sp. WSBS2006]
NRFAGRNTSAGEREYQTKFSKFLERFEDGEMEIRQFKKFGSFEADITLQGTGGADLSVVEVKEHPKFNPKSPETLENALKKAAMYTVKGCIMAKQTGPQIRRIAAVALPAIISRLG